MNRQMAVERLAANCEVFRNLVRDVSAEQARWKPSPSKWSILEVVCHLADEEREDFRRRLDLTIHDPAAVWPPIDPPRWAIEREYNARDLRESLADFIEERSRSIEWLRELPEPDYDAAHTHPTSGEISVGDLLTSWLAHDLIHIRQLTRLHYEYMSQIASPYSPDYAGDW